MLERWIVRHWIALCVGCILMGRIETGLYGTWLHSARERMGSHADCVSGREADPSQTQEGQKKMQEYREIKNELESRGYVISDSEFDCIVEYARMKAETSGKDGNYSLLIYQAWQNCQ